MVFITFGVSFLIAFVLLCWLVYELNDELTITSVIFCAIGAAIPVVQWIAAATALIMVLVVKWGGITLFRKK